MTDTRMETGVRECEEKSVFMPGWMPVVRNQGGGAAIECDLSRSQRNH